MLTDPQQQQLNALLRQGIDLLHQLDQLYESELESLTRQDIDTLSDITQRKTRLLTEFQQFRVQRTELLKSFGIIVDVNDYRLPAPADDSLSLPLSESLQQITAELQNLQRKNARNEQVISRSQKNIQQLLGIIRGQRQEDKLYNQSGSAGLYKAQSRIGKA